MNSNKPGSLNKLAIKSGSGYMLSNILIRASSLITAPIFTRILTTSDYGIASNFTAWLNIVLVMVGLGLPYSIGVAKMDFPSKLDNFLASIQTLGSSVAMIFFILAIIFQDKLAEIMELDKTLVLVIFGYLLFLPSVIYSQERYKFTLKYKENIYISLFSTIGAILFCLIFILYVFNDQRYYGRILGLIFPMFIMGVFFYFKILQNGWTKNITKYWSYALKISLPMIPHSLAMVVLTQIDRIMIVKYCGNSEAGLYSFGYSYAILLGLFSNAVLQAFQPWLYIKYKQQDIKSIKKVSNLIAAGMCILTLCIITLAPEAIKILGAKDFWEAKWVVMPIAIGALFQFVYNNYSGLELYHKKTIIIAIGSIFAAIINYYLNSTFIPIYGYIAASYTTFASYFALALFHLIAYRIVCKKSVYNDVFIWTIVIVTVILSFIILQFYNYFWIRYIIITVILVFIVTTQLEKIKGIYKMVLVNKKTIK